MEKGKLKAKHIEKLHAYGIEIEAQSDIGVFRYKKGEVILREGFQMEYLMVVISGKAKVYGSADNGRDLLLSYYIDEGIIGDVELMCNKYIASTTMITLTDFECIALPFEKWAKVLKSDITFMNHIGYGLATKLIRCSNKGVTTALHNGERRLCAYILQAAHQDLLDEQLTNVASAIGMSYRHMLRIVKRLCEEHILKKENKGYRVIDRSALEDRSFFIDEG